jgi:hypothetical protein
MSYEQKEQKDPRLIEEVGDLSLSMFANQIGLLYTLYNYELRISNYLVTI